MRTNTQTKRELDKIDRNILRILQADGRISFTELGEKVGLSTTPCTERVRRLERSKVILGYHAELDPVALENSHVVMVQVLLYGYPEAGIHFYLFLREFLVGNLHFVRIRHR